MKNLYNNTSDTLVNEHNVRNTDDYIKNKIKDKKVLDAVLAIMEFKQHIAFQKGFEYGKWENSQKLNEILNQEEPNFLYDLENKN